MSIKIVNGGVPTDFPIAGQQLAADFISEGSSLLEPAVSGSGEIPSNAIFVDASLTTDITNGSYNASTRANGPNGGGSDGDAYADLQDAIDAAGTNATRILLRGSTTAGQPQTYTGQFIFPTDFASNASAWTAGNFTSIESFNTEAGAASNEWAVLDGNNSCNTDTGYGSGFVIGRASDADFYSYIRLDRLEIKNGRSGSGNHGFGAFISGSNLWFRHLYIHDNKPTTANNLPGGISGVAWRNNIVEYCFVTRNTNGLNNPNGKAITWEPDRTANDAMNNNGTNGSTLSRNNIIRYNLVQTETVGIAPKNWCALSPRRIDLSNPLEDTYSDDGNETHHNIVLDCEDYPIGAHGDFWQVHHNIIENDASSGHPGIRAGYDWVDYPHIYKPCIYNNTIINLSGGVTSPAVFGIFQGYDGGNGSASDYDDGQVSYMWNNIADAFETGNNWISGEAIICPNLATSTFDMDSSGSQATHNYIYRPGSSSNHYSVYDDSVGQKTMRTYTSSGWESNTVTTNTPVAYTNAYDGGDLLYQGTTGVDRLKTRDAHVLESGVTISNGGVDISHPYLSGVSIPDYVGAGNGAWIDTVYNYNTLNGDGIPTNLRDGVTP